jgi:hypothetical protein
MKMTHVHRGIALWTVLCFMHSTIAWAQHSDSVRLSSPRLLVDAMKPGEEISTQQAIIAANVMKQAFDQTAQVKVADDKAVRSAQEVIGQVSAGSVDPKSFLAPAMQKLNQGKQAYRSLSFVQAQQLLLESRDYFLKHLKYLRTNQPLLEAHLYLGMTYLALSKEKNDDEALLEDAKNEFRKVVYLDSDHRLTDRSYSPEVIALFERVKQATLAQPRVTLQIQANVKRANVFINGQFEGKTPWSGQVLPGTYFVLVEDRVQSDQPWTKLVTLSRTIEQIRAGLSPVNNLVTYQQMFRIREGNAQQSSDVQALAQMAQASQSRYVFLGNVEQVDGYRLLGQLWDAQTQEFSQVAFIQMGPDFQEVTTAGYDLAQALVTQIAPNGYLVTSSYNRSAPTAETIANQRQKNPASLQAQSRPSLLKKWWFWAGLAVVGGGAYYLISQQSDGGAGEIKINNQGNF